MKRYLLTAGIAATSLIGNQSLAGTMGVISDYWGANKKVATVTLGPDFVYQGGSQNVTLLPPFQNTYASDRRWKSVGDFGGFLGIEHTVTDWLSAQVGVAGYGDSAIPISGAVWQFTVPAFDDLHYSYRIHHSRVVFANKLLTTIPRWQAAHPYFSWEIGGAFNHAERYQEHAVISGVNPAAPFASQSHTALTWGLGIGIDYSINPHIRTGIGYQFADLGSASLGATTAATSHNATLSLSHLYTNQLRFQLTYVL